VRIVINPASGVAEPVLSVLNDVLGPAEIEWDVVVTHEGGDAATAAREAAELGFDVVGVYGGDGTVGEVASALADGGPPLLLLPGGTGNVLAEELGIPPMLADAAALIVGDAYRIRRIDLGRAGDRLFVVRLTMGFEVEMVAASSGEMKGRYGWLAYALAGLQTLTEPPTATYSITVDGQTHERDGMAALIANSAGTGRPGVRIADDVDVSDGHLDVVVVRMPELQDWLGSAADAVAGRESRTMDHWRGTEIRVESNPPQPVLADGEEAGFTPVDVTVMPGALGVIVPATGSAG
jgi:YegS/Rv2252/BmrU family lipid kinase